MKISKITWQTFVAHGRFGSAVMKILRDYPDALITSEPGKNGLVYTLTAQNNNVIVVATEMGTGCMVDFFENNDPVMEDKYNRLSERQEAIANLRIATKRQELVSRPRN